MEEMCDSDMEGALMTGPNIENVVCNDTEGALMIGSSIENVVCGDMEGALMAGSNMESMICSDIEGALVTELNIKGVIYSNYIYSISKDEAIAMDWSGTLLGKDYNEFKFVKISKLLHTFNLNKYVFKNYKGQMISMTKDN